MRKKISKNDTKIIQIYGDKSTERLKICFNCSDLNKMRPKIVSHDLNYTNRGIQAYSQCLERINMIISCIQKFVKSLFTTCYFDHGERIFGFSVLLNFVNYESALFLLIFVLFLTVESDIKFSGNVILLNIQNNCLRVSGGGYGNMKIWKKGYGYLYMRIRKIQEFKSSL